jgi:hypothetical protein
MGLTASLLVPLPRGLGEKWKTDKAGKDSEIPGSRSRLSQICWNCDIWVSDRSAMNAQHDELLSSPASKGKGFTPKSDNHQ